MGLFDKAKEMATNAASMAADAATQKAGEMKAASDAKAAEKSAKRELAQSFHETRRFGELSIDSSAHLLKIRHATAKLQKKSGALGTAGKATMAMMTLGASVAVEAAMKPSDVIVPFSDVRGYAVIQDDEEIQGGTLGAAAVGGLLLGGVGAVIGAAGGSRKQKKVVNTMALRVDLRDLDMPCAIVTYIGKPTKTKSGDYQKAVAAMQEAMSCLDLIMETSEK